MAFKANVVKTCWKVITKERDGYRKKDYLIWAESEETARLQVPETEEVLSVEHLDGGGGGVA